MNPKNQLESFLTSLPETVVATCRHPMPRIHIQLRELDSDFTDKINNDIIACQQAVEWANTVVIGVCGTINSGKSTLVSSFLSPHGNKRILIGQREKAGTQRFVFWLPSDWENNSQQENLTRTLCNLTGRTPGILSDDIEQAHLQYNDAESLGIPLLAFDPELNKSGFGFLDCPDIQRESRDSSRQSAPQENVRLDSLLKLTPLCSAMILIASGQQLGTKDVDQLFRKVADTMPNIPLAAVINMTRIPSKKEIAEEFGNRIQQMGLSSRIKRRFFCKDLPNANATPQFADLEKEDGSIADWTESLNPATCQRDKLQSTLKSLRIHIRESVEQVKERTRQSERRVKNCYEKIDRFVQQAFVDPENGNPRFPADPDLIKQLNESILRTAPKDIRMSKSMLSSMKRSGEKVWDFAAKRFHTKKNPPKCSIQYLEDLFNSCFYGFKHFVETPEHSSLENAWKKIWTHCKSEWDKAMIDSNDIDAITKELWAQIPWWKKRTLITNLMLISALLAASALLIPVDGGSSLIKTTVFGKTMILSNTELLMTIGGGSILSLAKSNPAINNRILEIQLKFLEPRLAILRDVLCDAFAIPRCNDRVPDSSTSTANSASPFSCTETRCLINPLVSFNDQKVSEILSHIDHHIDSLSKNAD